MLAGFNEPPTPRVDAGVCMSDESLPDPTAAPVAGAEAAIELPASVVPEATPAVTAPATAPEPFSQPLEVRAPDPASGTLALGQKVRGKILSIGDEHAIVSVSGRPDAILPTREFRTADGTLLLRVDDSVSMLVQTVETPPLLAIDKRRLVLNALRLRIAHENHKPVSGAVRAVNKGGFEVRVAGVRCFCPLSQMDAAVALDPKSHVGQTYNFRILRWEQGGRSIVLSRRAILKVEAEARAVETRKTLAVGAEFDGVVTRVQPFGAFVDIGGIEGLLHVSRMGRGHVNDPGQIVEPGRAVRVTVTKIDAAGTGKERIALEARDLGPDPWEQSGEQLKENAVLHGRIVRATEFGVFVNLLPGIDGLVHATELQRSLDAGGAPLAVGDEIDVRVTRVDGERRRVSLSLRLEPPPPRAAAREAREGREPRDGRDARTGGREARREPRGGRPGRPRRERDRDRDGERETAPFAAGSSLTHTMAEQLGALRGKLQIRP
jgi:small subunit ribosomal protein S1